MPYEGANYEEYVPIELEIGSNMIVYPINRYIDTSAGGFVFIELWISSCGFDIIILNIGFGFRF